MVKKLPVPAGYIVMKGCNGLVGTWAFKVFSSIVESEPYCASHPSGTFRQLKPGAQAHSDQHVDGALGVALSSLCRTSLHSGIPEV